MHPRRTSPSGYERARSLRHETTPAEKKLWVYLRRGQLLGVRFRRQHPIGPYVTDFCSLKAKLVIEVDGSQHLEQQQDDLERTAFLVSQGYRVMRFWNDEILKDVKSVAIAITAALPKKRTDKAK